MDVQYTDSAKDFLVQQQLKPRDRISFQRENCEQRLSATILPTQVPLTGHLQLQIDHFGIFGMLAEKLIDPQHIGTNPLPNHQPPQRYSHLERKLQPNKLHYIKLFNANKAQSKAEHSEFQEKLQEEYRNTDLEAIQAKENTATHEIWLELARKIDKQTAFHDPIGFVIEVPSQMLPSIAISNAIMLGDIQQPIVFIEIPSKKHMIPEIWLQEKRQAAIEVATTSEFAEILICSHAHHQRNTFLFHRAIQSQRRHAFSSSGIHSPRQRPLLIKTDEQIRLCRPDPRIRSAPKQIKRQISYEANIFQYQALQGQPLSYLSCILDQPLKALQIVMEHPDQEQEVHRQLHNKAERKGIWLSYIYKNGEASQHKTTEAMVLETPTLLPEVARIKLGWALSQSQRKSEIETLLREG